MRRWHAMHGQSGPRWPGYEIALMRPNMGAYHQQRWHGAIVAGHTGCARRRSAASRCGTKRSRPCQALDADLVAMTVQTFTARRAYDLADAYRAQGIRVVMGGYHPSRGFCPTSTCSMPMP